MSDPYFGEIRLVAFANPPFGWEFCHGQQISATSYPDLAAAIGSTYGTADPGNVRLPNLRGRIPLHGSSAGTNGGANQVEANVPPHAHTAYATTVLATTPHPAGSYLATSPAGSANFGDPGVGAPIVFSQDGGMIEKSGSPHENRQPFVGLNYIIFIGFPPPVGLGPSPP